MVVVARRAWSPSSAGAAGSSNARRCVVSVDRGVTWPPPIVERAGAPRRRSSARRTPSKRMLVIVNPYATTVSDRLKNLVVYALQRPLRGRRRRHRGPRPRHRAVPRGRAEGYDVVVAFGGDGTVNEAANGLAGSDTPLTCLPGRRDQRLLPHRSASPARSSTPPSTCCGWPTTGARAASTSARSTAARFTFSCRPRPRRERRRAGRPPPATSRPASAPWYFT